MAPDGQARNQPVPHHPAAGGEVEHPVAAVSGRVQLVFLQVLQQRAAGAVHDAFRRAGGARGEQDVERMVERQLREVDRARGVRREEVGQAQRVGEAGRSASPPGRAPRSPFARVGSALRDLGAPCASESIALPLYR